MSATNIRRCRVKMGELLHSVLWVRGFRTKLGPDVCKCSNGKCKEKGGEQERERENENTLKSGNQNP